MSKKVLIANRGEIVKRISRTCKRLGYETVSIYSSQDKDSPHTKFTDESVLLAGNDVAETYLNISNIIDICKEKNIWAVHPGYGFLSENPDFSKQLNQNGIKFLGPSDECMRLLGDKQTARELAERLKVPILNGERGPFKSLEDTKSSALKIGFPFMLKANFGGGGKGIRRINSEEELTQALESAKREAKSFFSNDAIFIEKVLPNARHIEVQIAGDLHGNILCFGERECSLQRRFQKVIEEAPAVGISGKLRKAIHEAALKMAISSKLYSLSTFEFLVSKSGEDFYFLEANPRLQVEHPVTELVYGIDLVELQLIIAEGNPLNINHLDIEKRRSGHAVEARVYAEIPERGFIPSEGKIVKLILPEENSNLRLEHALSSGQVITSDYDPMLLKIISKSHMRVNALNDLRTAIKNTAIIGLDTNLGFLIKIIDKLEYEIVTTDYLDTNHNLLTEIKDYSHIACIIHVLSEFNFQLSSLGFELGKPRKHYLGKYEVYLSSIDKTYNFSVSYENTIEVLNINETSYHVTSSLLNDASLCLTINNLEYSAKYLKISKTFDARLISRVFIEGYNYLVQPKAVKVFDATLALGADNQIKSHLPGITREILAKETEIYEKGAPLIIIESMKTEHTITAPDKLKVTKIHVSKNSKVTTGDILLTIECIE